MKRLFLSLFLPLCFAAALPVAKPEDAGVSTERLQRVDALLDGYIARREIAGSVALVARKGKIVHFKAQGVADLASKKPMEKDAIFRLASMTKPIASLAVMILHEEGKFLLDDPVSRFLPEFADMKVAVPNAPHERTAGGYRIVPAERPITIRHLLSHTSGLASGTSGVTISEYQGLLAKRSPASTIAEYTAALAKLPLTFQPGTAWEYSPSVDVLGRLVEVVSGQPFDQFLRQRILDPLGMKDTWFYLPGDRLDRLVTAYRKNEGKLEKLTAVNVDHRAGKLFSGSGGLAGTAEDYLRLCQMFLNGGVLDGKRIVSRKTIEAMTTNQIGDLPLWQDSYRGYGFGLGFRVRKTLGGTATLGSVGEYGWGGAYGTYFWIDPKEQMVGILMIQLMPYAHLNLRPEFQNVVTQSIID